MYAMKKSKFEYNFHTNFGGGVITFPMKVEKWGRRQKGLIRFIALNFIVPLLKKWWVEVKVNQTMSDVDHQAEDLVEMWEEKEKQDNSHIEYTSVEDPNSPFGVKEMRVTDKRFY